MVIMWEKIRNYLEAIQNLTTENSYFPIFHSFMNGRHSGFYTLYENANAPIFYGKKGTSLDGHGNSWSFLGSTSQIQVFDSLILTSIEVGDINSSSNSEFLLTPWNPNGTLPLFGLKVINGQKLFFVNSNTTAVSNNITKLYLKLYVYSDKFNVTLFGNELLPQNVIYSINGTINVPRIMAAGYQQYTYGESSSTVFTVNYVFDYTTALANDELHYHIYYNDQVVYHIMCKYKPPVTNELIIK